MITDDNNNNNNHHDDCSDGNNTRKWFREVVGVRFLDPYEFTKGKNEKRGKLLYIKQGKSTQDIFLGNYM